MLSGDVLRVFRRTPLLLLFTCLTAGISIPSRAANVTLAWDPSLGPNVVSYNVYVGGQTMTFTNVISAGGSTNLTVSNLVAGATYYFAATAVNASGLESDFSNELGYTVPIGPVTNATPTLALISPVTVAESSSARTVPLSGISSGAARENQVLTVTAASSNPGLIPHPTVNYTSPNSSGSLVFTPVPYAYGTATMTVTVDDGQAENNTFSRQFLVTVTPVNQAPTLNALANLVLNENAGVQSVTLSGISSGASNEFDTLKVTAVSSNPNLIPNPAVNYISPNASGTLTFVPVLNASGVATISVTVNDGQAQNSSVTRSFTVTVNAVNQPPTLDALASMTIPEGSGAQTVALTGISSGASNEPDVLTVTALSSNPGLIPTPVVSYRSPNATGTLIFTPIPFANGDCVITLTVSDGQAQVARSFTVTVTPVNQPPTLDALADVSLQKNSGSLTINLRGISSGATNELQTLSVTGLSSNPGLVPHPLVNYTSPAASGTLVLNPVAEATGTAIITVTVNDGDPVNGAFSRSFKVYVDPGNQAPTLDPIADLVVPQGSGLQIVNLSGISSGAPGEFDTLMVTAKSGNPSVVPDPIVSYVSPGSSGSLTFTPVAGSRGSATITVTVNDGQSQNNTTARSFTVVVDATPSISAIPDQQMFQGSPPVQLAFTVSDAESDAATLTVSAVSSLASLLPVQNIQFGGSGGNRTATLMPVAGQLGSADVWISVTDGHSSATAKFRLTVLPKEPTGNQAPVITAIGDQSTVENVATAPINFAISDTDTPLTSLSISAQSSNPSLLPAGNIMFRGYGNSRSVILLPMRGQRGGAEVTILVSDGSATASVMFHFTVHGASGIVTINKKGKGRVISTVNADAMMPGRTYTISAVPELGQEFLGWSGSLNASSPQLTFTVNSRMYLEAHFVASPFLPVQGAYSGLFHESGKVRQFSSGVMKVSVTARGTYSGQVQIGTQRYALSGKLNTQLQATNLILRPLNSPLLVEFRLGSGAEADQFFGRVTEGTWVAAVEGDRSVFNTRTNPAPWAGSYTIVVPGEADGASAYPAGNGYGTVKVMTNGVAVLSSTLGDGTRLSFSASVSRNGDWPLYAPLYAGSGSILSWISFADRTTDDFHGDLSWIKPANIYSRQYPAGFVYQCEAVGSRYRAPKVPGERVLQLTAGNVALQGGNLSHDLSSPVTIDDFNRVTSYGNNRLTLTLSPTTGLFRGSVFDATTGRTLGYNGAVFQKLNAGYGMLIGTNQTSSVTITP